MTSCFHPLTEVPAWGCGFRFVAGEEEIGHRLVINDEESRAFWDDLVDRGIDIYGKNVTGWVDVP